MSPSSLDSGQPARVPTGGLGAEREAVQALWQAVFA